MAKIKVVEEETPVEEVVEEVAEEVVEEVAEEETPVEEVVEEEAPVEEKTDTELVREYAMGTKYDLKDPKTYNAILKIIKGK